MKVPKKQDIPFELQDTDHWVLWFEKKRNGKLAKIPAAPWETGHWKNASPTDAENWTSLEEALSYAKKREGYGVGFVFSEKDGFVGIDFDDFVNGGEIEEWVEKCYRAANSYTEYSPSGNGLHLIGRGKIPENFKNPVTDNEVGIEIYDHERFFTVTGDFVKGTKIIREIQEIVDKLCQKYGEKEENQINYKKEDTSTETPFSVIDVLNEYAPNNDLKEHGEGLQGSHPKHGSDTGFNFKVVPDKNIWTCFHSGHECGGGPFELLAVFEEIVECGSWGWGDETPLIGDKWIETVDAALDRRLISEEKAERLKGKPIEAEIIPSEISAELVDKKVKVRGRVVREKQKKALPSKALVRCRSCEKSSKFDVNEGYVRKKLVFKGRKRTDNILKNMGKHLIPGECVDGNNSHNLFAKPIENIDYSIVWLKDCLEDMDERRGNRDVELKVAVIGPELPNSRKIEVVGELAVHPVSADIMLIADEVEPLELVPENLELSAEMLHYCTKAFGGTVSEEEAPEGISAKKLHYCTNGSNTTVDLRNQVAPDMVGRKLVRESRLLVLHSPILIPDIEGENLIRGSLRECLFGDTKTYKSASVKDLTENHYQLGDYTVAETSSRAGLVYSVDTDNRALTWGTLPLNDKGYVGIDGLNELHSSEMREFREVLESQKVIVRKFVSGEANARVRISACMNPENSMNQYLSPCEALKDTYIFQKSPEITRWDIFIPFNDSDVSKEKIANREQEKRPISDDVFKNHVLWAWSRGPEDIEYTEEAVKKVKKESPKLIEKYGISELPIVHNGVRDVITRLSVAFACLKHSTEDHETVVVKKDHVDYALAFYRDMLDKLGVIEYKEMLEEDLTLSQKDFIEVTQEIDETHIAILDQIKLGPKSSSELAEKIGKSKSTIKNKYELFKEYDLIEAKPSKGITLSKKGVQFVRKLLGFDVENSNLETISAIVQDSCTNEPSQKEIVEKILNFYEEYGDPDWSVPQFLDTLEEQFKDLNREDLKPHVLKLKEDGEITLSEVGEIEDLEKMEDDSV